MGNHAKLSASSSSRWLNCTASVAAIDYLHSPDGGNTPHKTNKFAEEGTCAHELAEICLNNGKSPQDYIYDFLTEAPDIRVNKEMADYIEGYIEYVRSFETDTSELMIEHKVSYSDYALKGFGTSDVILRDGNVCHIIDLKYGMGGVNPKDNSQLMLYALGAYQEFGRYPYELKTFHLHIYQPRINNISQWEISIKDLLIFGEKSKLASKKIETGDTEFNPSEKACQWCDFKGHCKELKLYNDKVIGCMFDAVPATPPLIENTDLGKILDNKKIIESWLKAVEEVIFDKISDGQLVEGYKIVHGRSSNKWDNENEVARKLKDYLGDKAYSKKLLSPAQARKNCNAKDFTDISHHITRSTGKPTLAKANDKRESLNDCSDLF